jgi:benzaldehyde dehydrogenase (NAD)
MDESIWRCRIHSGSWITGDPGHGSDALVTEPATRREIGGTANVEAFTDTRWVTIRGDIAPHPF